MIAPHIARPLRLLAVGDVGRSSAYHVGDDAMLKGLIDTARHGAVSVEWTVMSSEPSRTASAWGVRAVPRLTFEDCADASGRDARLAAVDRVLHTAPAEWPSCSHAPWREALAAIAAADAVVLAGGGNLSRSWPGEVFERSAVARAAGRAGRPVALTSQTLGPSFDDRTRMLTADLVRDALVVGLREASSYALALELGARPARTVLQFDDAIGVQPEEPPWWRDLVGDAPVIAVTINQIGDTRRAEETAALIGRHLAEVSRLTDAAVLLVPHVGDLGGMPAHDVLMGRAIAAAAGDARPVRITPLPTPGQAVWVTARAELVVSTRYHPIVFGAATATPSLFLSQDHYTFVKGVGALNLVGLGSWTLPVAAAAAGLLVPATRELWNRRREVRAHLHRLAPTIDAQHRRHVADLLTALATGSPQARPTEPMPCSSGPVASDAWVAQAHDGTVILDATLRVRQLEAQLGDAAAAIAAQTREMEHKEASLVVAQAALEEQVRSTHVAHAAWEADRAALVSHGEGLERRAAAAEQVAETLGREVERKDSELRVAHAALEDLTRTTHEAHAAWQADRAALEAHRERIVSRAAEAARMVEVLTREVERKEADLLTAHAALAEHARRQS